MVNECEPFTANVRDDSAVTVAVLTELFTTLSDLLRRLVPDIKELVPMLDEEYGTLPRPVFTVVVNVVKRYLVVVSSPVSTLVTREGMDGNCVTAEGVTSTAIESAVTLCAP